MANRAESLSTDLKSSSSMYAATSARLASSATGFLGERARKTSIMRIDCESNCDRVTPAAASSWRSAGLVNASDAVCRDELREAEEVAFDRGRVGIRPPEIDQVGDRLQGLAALAQKLADAGVFEIAGLDQAAPDDHRPLIFLDLAIGLADREKLVEREDQLGGFFLDDLEIGHDLARLLFLDVDQEQHPRGVLGDIVAEGVAAEERLERLAGLGKPAGVEVGLATGEQLVRRGLVGVGAGLAGLANAQLARPSRDGIAPVRRRS